MLKLLLAFLLMLALPPGAGRRETEAATAGTDAGSAAPGNEGIVHV